jgi:hypothetical protein
MLHLMKKFSFHFILYSFLLLPVFTMFSVGLHRTLEPITILYQGVWILLIVVGAVLIHEKTEHLTNAYAFLRTLPVRSRDIVTAKFLLVLCSVAFLIPYYLVLYALNPGSDYHRALGRGLVFIYANLALVAAALMFIILYRFGFTAFLRIGWIFFAVLVVGFVVFVEMILVRKRVDIRSMAAAVAGQSWLFWVMTTVGSLVIFFALLPVAVKAKEASRD